MSDERPGHRPCQATYWGTACEWGAGHPSGTDASGNYADHGAPSRKVWWTTSADPVTTQTPDEPTRTIGRLLSDLASAKDERDALSARAA